MSALQKDGRKLQVISPQEARNLGLRPVNIYAEDLNNLRLQINSMNPNISSRWVIVDFGEDEKEQRYRVYTRSD